MTELKALAPLNSGGMDVIIAKAMENGDVATLEKLLSMNERIMAKQAEIDFNQAMAKLQTKLPIIHQASQIKHGDKLIAKYAKYEDIDRQIRPLYVGEGFSLSYDSQKLADGSIQYTGKVSHVAGHSITAEVILPADESGAKNKVQAQGSSITYAKRYLLTMLLNLVFTGEDDDASSLGKPVDDADTTEIKELMKKHKVDTDKFLEFFNIKKIEDMQKKDFKKAISMIKAKEVKE
jgi:hypothetical protein